MPPLALRPLPTDHRVPSPRLRSGWPGRRTIRGRWALLVALTVLGATGAGAAEPTWQRSSLPLPGVPGEILAADLDRDGAVELVVLVAFSQWGERTFTEETTMDQVQGLVEVLTVVPALFDRRELRVYRGLAAGRLDTEPVVLPLESAVLSLARGGPGWEAIVLTDDGVSALRLRDREGAAELLLEPLIAERPVLAGSGAFVPRLRLVHDLDADGLPDLLLPTAAGATVYLGGPQGLAPTPASRVALPLDDPKAGDGRLLRHYPVPVIRDLDGDRLPELLVSHPRRDWNEPRIWRNLGRGRFAAPVSPLPAAPETERRRPGDGESETEVVYLGDLDGDGRAEYVTAESREPGNDASMREELDHAKRPQFKYRIHRMGESFALEPRPRSELDATGHAFHGGGGIGLPGGFQDLDGDGRQDLIALTLDFSLLQAARVLVTQRISIGLDFGVWCQTAAGRFRAVQGLDLSGKFLLDLNDLRIERLAQFAGDFDGDGRADYTQIGRGREVTIHRGRPGCGYGKAADWRIRLDEPPQDLSLVRVEDLNGDGRADLLVIRSAEAPAGAAPEERQRATLDLHLSVAGGVR